MSFTDQDSFKLAQVSLGASPYTRPSRVSEELRVARR